MKAQVSVGVVGLRQFGSHSGNTISDERHWKNALSWSASRQTTRIARFESLIGYRREGEFVAPKTVTSARRIDLTDALIAELREWRLACPIGADDLIFPNLDGKPLCHSNLLQRGFYPALRRAGLRQIRFHDLRHTFASLLLANGEDVVRVSRLLGHSSKDHARRLQPCLADGALWDGRTAGTCSQWNQFGNGDSNSHRDRRDAVIEFGTERTT